MASETERTWVSCISARMGAPKDLDMKKVKGEAFVPAFEVLGECESRDEQQMFISLSPKSWFHGARLPGFFGGSCGRGEGCRLTYSGYESAVCEI